ncbi:hypothetical protein TNCV_1519591 [Trichonephila clavipes]|nr:hypothetical protein TNCV_1519591 [Trichonephila clavipes]
MLHHSATTAISRGSKYYRWRDVEVWRVDASSSVVLVNRPWFETSLMLITNGDNKYIRCSPELKRRIPTQTQWRNSS